MFRISKMYRVGENESELIVEIDDTGKLTTEERARLFDYFMPTAKEESDDNKGR